LIAARQEAILLALVFTPVGVAAVAIGALVGDETSLLASGLAALAFASLGVWSLRTIRDLPPILPAAGELESAVRTLPFPVIWSAMVLAFAFAGEGVFGGMVAGGGLGSAIRVVWLRRFERQVGCTVVRQLWGSRMLLLYRARRRPLGGVAA
jgi:hypothetical protein